MQPIIVLGAAVVGLALLGSGFLGNPDDVWNRITLFVQEMGWGEAQIESPISAATIDLELKKVKNSNGSEDPTDDFFDNIIRACSFHSLQSIPAASGDPSKVLAHPLIICKILNGAQQAIGEGKLILDGVDRSNPDAEDIANGVCKQREAETGYLASDHISIDICQCAFEGACDVQKAHDIKIIVEGAISEQVSGEQEG